jgi:2-hydroxychromene-2-carboxylate isomerase
LDNVFDRYVAAVFKAMWAEQKKMDDAEVAAAVLQQAGLDGARLIARTQEPEVKDRLLKNTEASVERGTFGAPTFFVGDEIFFGKDRLRDVEEEVAGATT